jgi:hypothetical protein
MVVIAQDVLDELEDVLIVRVETVGADVEGEAVVVVGTGQASDDGFLFDQDDRFSGFTQEVTEGQSGDPGPDDDGGFAVILRIGHAGVIALSKYIMLK